jgi:hypothetical protein
MRANATTARGAVIPRAESACAGASQDPRDRPEAALLGVRERPRSLAVGEVDVGARVHDQPHRLGVRRPALAQHDRLEQRGPAQAVDVVDFDRCREQPAHDVGEAALGGADQAGAVVGVQRAGVGAVAQR